MVIGPFQFDSPLWLLAFPICAILTLLIARRSLQGLGRVSRAVTLTLRLIVLLLLSMVLAEPNWRDVSDDVAVILVQDTSASMPADRTKEVDRIKQEVLEGAEAADRFGIVSAAVTPQIRAVPAPPRNLAPDSLATKDWLELQREGTDLAAAIRLALAIVPRDAATRIVLSTDGNETDGSLLEAAQAARVAGIPIDILPAPFDLAHEVIVEGLVAPATARKGQTSNLRVVLNTTAPARGTLALAINGLPVDLNADLEGINGMAVDLPGGRRVVNIPVTMLFDGRQVYELNFEPERTAMDTNHENNRALAVTFVAGRGRVLFYTNNASRYQQLLDAFAEAGIDVEPRLPGEGHGSLLELMEYDAVILADVPADDFTYRQHDELFSYVHDAGGGFLMIGGELSFGAGGWIGTRVAEVLPVRLDPPQKREIPQGALALIMHSVEMPNGTYWGKETARAAVNTLSRLDLVGVLEYAGGFTSDGVAWRYQMQEKGDGIAVNQAINALQFGDMPDFSPTIRHAYDGLTTGLAAGAGQRHCIIISDGDPSPPPQSLLNKFVAANITISTVCIFPHAWGNTSQDIIAMKRIAEQTGGRDYVVQSQQAVADLPRIFIKEAQIVKRPLISEPPGGVQPDIVDFGAETMRGIRAIPPILGYVITAPREGSLARVTIEIPNEHKDPLAAQWQFGLGRAVAFTSDGSTRWNANWLEWNQFRAFWEQHLRYVMRPSGSSNMNVVTQSRGDRTRVIVTARDEAGDTLNGVVFSGTVIDPELGTRRVDLRQTGPGRYEGEFESSKPGAYAFSAEYRAPGADGVVDRGSVVAAVTRPFADEYRALKDNLPLLRQVVDLTGGRELTDEDAVAQFFSRDGLVKPVALQPIWLPLALATLLLFLADVGVRRVRIDILWAWHAVQNSVRREKKQGAAQLGALKSARARTQEKLTQRSTPGQPAPPPVPDRRTAQRKFEADPSQLKDTSAPITQVKPGESRRPIEDRTKKKDADAKPDEAEGMSRLLQAKKRARESMDKDQNDDK